MKTAKYKTQDNENEKLKKTNIKQQKGTIFEQVILMTDLPTQLAAYSKCEQIQLPYLKDSRFR